MHGELAALVVSMLLLVGFWMVLLVKVVVQM